MAIASGSTQHAGDESGTDGIPLEIQSMGFSAQLIGQLAAPDLWHLSANYAGASDFIDAWSQQNGSGVVISVVDEGVNYRHVDLQGAYDTALDYDPRDTGSSDAAPDTSTQGHGTNVAGLLAGDINNNIGTVGGAQGSTIAATYLRFGTLFDLSELDGVIAHQKNFDVSNNSWGFTQAFSDNFQSQQFAGTAAALQSVAEDGRDGLGTVMVVAAGNGKIETASGNIGDDSNFHNFSNSRFVIAVGAHDMSGAPAFFSSPGTNVLLTAPGVGLLTTDGTAPGSTGAAIVSGTSFAAPLVSSTVALMLAENPDLGYRDVQEILAISATSRIDGVSQQNGFGAFNGGGLMFERDGGFGMLDASAAVALARNWSQTSTLANEKELDFSFAPATGLNGSYAELDVNLTVSDPKGFSTGSVELDLTVTDADLKDLNIVLVSPHGTRAELAENLLQMGNRTYLSFTFSSIETLGEDPAGTWKLELTHATASSNFAVYRADLHVYGDAGTKDDTYYYTSSYAALAAADPSRTHAVDTDGGVDTLNFAAGSGKVVLDLSGATASRFQDTPVYLDGTFENAIGTVHDDILTGSAAANRLVGDLGNDVVSGGAGDDTLLGGDGDDILDGGAGSDTIDGGAGVDTAVFESARAAYDITFDASNETYTIVHGSEVDTVKNVEHFAFADKSIDVTMHPEALLSSGAPSPLGTQKVSIKTVFAAGHDSFDFNGDGKTDLFLVNTTDDGVAVWQMDGTTVTAKPQVGTINGGGGWYYADKGDTDGGKTDLLLLNDTTHDVAIWQMDGTQVIAKPQVGTINAAAGWGYAGMADFNGDGKSDLLFFNDTNNGIAVWQMDGTTVTATPQVATMAAGFHLAAMADFNGDGKTDLLTLNDATHAVDVRLMNGVQTDTTESQVGSIDAASGWHFADVGDFNGDGKTDLLLLNDTTHGVAVWEMDGTHVIANAQVGTVNAADGWHFADVGDFNGDGKSDLLLLNDSNHGVAVWEMDGTHVIANPQVGTVNAAAGWHYQGLGDFNGDHKSDLLLVNDTNHGVAVWEMDGTHVIANPQIGTVNAAADWHLVA
jgi:subtilisin-like proprotein convertase family protein